MARAGPLGLNIADIITNGGLLETRFHSNAANGSHPIPFAAKPIADIGRMCRMAPGKRGIRMELQSAQRAMRAANVAGAPGVLVSGIVWVVAGLVWLRLDIPRAFAVLFFGGMAIVPIALFIARVLFRIPKPADENPLDRLGLESTFPLFAGLLISYALLRIDPDLVFPVMAITIGARYFSFRTIYGDAFYWILATALVAIGVAALFRLISWPINVALAAGVVEIGFAFALFVRREGVQR